MSRYFSHFHKQIFVVQGEEKGHILNRLSGIQKSTNLGGSECIPGGETVDSRAVFESFFWTQKIQKLFLDSLSATDPDASIVRHCGKPRLRYQTHRLVDGAFEIITATEVTGGDVNEAHRLTSLMDNHQANTGKPGIWKFFSEPMGSCGKMVFLQTR